MSRHLTRFCNPCLVCLAVIGDLNSELGLIRVFFGGLGRQLQDVKKRDVKGFYDDDICNDRIRMRAEASELFRTPAAWD